MNNNRVLLMGPPNVGKSVFFNRLTGLDVGMANYSGTTVEYKLGTAKLAGEEIELIDVPGIYTLDATNEAEEVALEMLDEDPEAIICVLDANNLESSLYLLLQILERGISTVVALNRVDLLEEKGEDVDYKLLEDKLKVPVIPTVAITGKGIEKIEEKAKEVLADSSSEGIISQPPNWERAEQLAKLVIDRKDEANLLSRERWGELLVRPWPGLPLAVVILGLIFGAVVGIGLGIRQYLLLPFFRGLVFPWITALVEGIVGPGILRNVLIGEYGFLIKSLEWPFALVLPYVLSFYTALAVLEDSGYLPRLGVLLDGMLSKIGLSGENIIPLLLGYGCAIPGIAGTRTMKSRKKRIIVSTMICISVPCIAQTGAIISLLAERSILVMMGLFLLSFLALMTAGIILNKVLEPKNHQMVLEVPELLVPDWNMLGKKIWIRLKSYLFNGAVTMIYAIGLASLLYELGVLEVIGNWMQP